LPGTAHHPQWPHFFTFNHDGAQMGRCFLLVFRSLDGTSIPVPPKSFRKRRRLILAGAILVHCKEYQKDIMQRHPKILIVDDSELSRLLLHTILKDAGYEDVVTTESPREMFNLLAGSSGEADDGFNIDLILMDIVMPGMDGIEATRQLRADGRFRDIPIVMVSVRDEEESLDRAFDAGAIDYISKPVSKVELRARVRSILRLKDEMERRIARERELLVLTQRLEEANEKLRRLSNLDGLTGIANRRYLDEVLPREWLRAARDRQPIFVIMVDIDFFKSFNDTYGHQHGDVCLKRVATALKKAMRRPADLLARYGGEEFIAVLPETDLSGAMKVAQTMRSNVSSMALEHSGSGVGSCVTLSIGLDGMIPDHGTDPSLLVAASDEALMEAKREGRDRIKIGRINRATGGSCSFARG
jgi:diguanylate cyclase (GGDEF)-like protein